MCVAHQQAQEAGKVENDWTVMIFFAGDPHLSPSMTSQLKAIKDAGFQENTTVLVHYDPNERGVGTTTFEINRMRKKEKPTVIGDGKDPFVRNLIEDSIPGATRSATAAEALLKFLDIGLREFTAKHYIIFLVGHGVIVGNDAFLPDNHPESGVTLQQLGDILSDFSRGAEIRGGAVELIGLHSCSMSAIEVLYELKGSARYLMATEGVSFVSSWPYRQLLKKILNTMDEAKKNGSEVKVDDLIASIQKLSLHNSTDFMFSGLSADLALCSLNPERVDKLDSQVRELTRALKKGLNDKRGLELITMAHLKSQSYWQENYTDLYDFCLCLERECKEGGLVQDAMKAACEHMRGALKETNQPEGLIVQSDYFGPQFQYSHGLSVYFPWAAPCPENSPFQADDTLGRYRNYKFTEVLGEDSWLSFLEAYFKETRRRSREEEDNLPAFSTNGRKPGASISPVVMGVSSMSIADSLEPSKPSPPLQKPAPPLFDGAGCGCTVKNYPMEFTRSPRAAQDPNAQASVPQGQQYQAPAPASR